MASVNPVFAFDAYGTLFDVHAAASRQRDAIGPQWERFSQTWRTKHLEYTWIHAQTGRHTTFWTLTERSLDFAAASIGGIAPSTRAALLAAYRKMAAFPEVPGVLAALKAKGARLSILSNGDPDMIADAVESAGLAGQFDHLLSIQQAGVFKPAMAVYRLVTDTHACQPAHVRFLSSNRWDVAGGAVFGFHAIWVNRTGAPDEYPDMPARETVRDLSALVHMVSERT
jgi:2-haloacid dehalogenase